MSYFATEKDVILCLIHK